MHSPKVQDKPRSVGRAYAGDLLVQIAQHEDHDQKQYGYPYESSPSSSSRGESEILPASPTLTAHRPHPPRREESRWPGGKTSRSRVFDSDSYFPPVFFPRSSPKRAKSCSPPSVLSSPVKVSLGFRIFQIGSILIVGICLYALVDNIIFLVKNPGDDSYFSTDVDSKPSSLNIHEQLQSWIIHGEAEQASSQVLPHFSLGGISSSSSSLSASSSSPSSSSSSSGGTNLISSQAVSISRSPTAGHHGHHPPAPAAHATVNSRSGSPNLTFILNNSSVCSSVRKKSSGKGAAGASPPGEGIYFMIIVHSAPDHFTERQAIRSTWGSVKSLKNLAIRLVFVLGKYSARPPNPILEASIRRENELFGDIVLGNFVDSYRNLTYKHLLGYKWIRDYCSGATFILKTDDDAFVDIFQLFDFISRNYGLAPKPGTLICNVFPEGTKPVRAKSARGSKWSVTLDEYPHAVYPRYCGGLAYLATPDVIRRILDVSDHVKFFWIDDVFVTGILREIAQIEPFYLNLRYLYDPEEYRNWLLPAGTPHKSDNSPRHSEADKKAAKRLRKFPFLFAHIERGDKFSEEMNDLWRKTLRSL